MPFPASLTYFSLIPRIAVTASTYNAVRIRTPSFHEIYKAFRQETTNIHKEDTHTSVGLVSITTSEQSIMASMRAYVAEYSTGLYSCTPWERQPVARAGTPG